MIWSHCKNGLGEGTERSIEVYSSMGSRFRGRLEFKIDRVGQWVVNMDGADGIV